MRWPRGWRISQTVFQAVFQFVDLWHGDLQTLFVELEETFSWLEEKVMVTGWLGTIFSGEEPASYGTRALTSRFRSSGQGRALEPGVSCPVSVPSYRDRTRLAFRGWEDAGEQQEGKSWGDVALEELAAGRVSPGSWLWELGEREHPCVFKGRKKRTGVLL